MTLLVAVIPAHNEEETVGEVVKRVPRNIEGIDVVRILVLDDGSSDSTYQKALEGGADRVVQFSERKGLSRVFRRGLQEALSMGGDIIVTLDADMQHNPLDIPRLIRPLTDGLADIVLGSRFLREHPMMPMGKRLGNRFFTWVSRWLSGTKITDSQTGFRAYTREAATRLNVHSDYTYTQETLIQAAHKKLRIAEIQIEAPPREGDSRLMSNLFGYARRAGTTILLTYLIYRPLRFFLAVGGLTTLAGLVVGSRVLWHFATTGQVSPFLPSAILTAVLILLGFQVFTVGLVAEMIKANRELLEELITTSRTRNTHSEKNEEE